MEPSSPHRLGATNEGQSSEAGVVVLGHGSRAPEAGVLLRWLADCLDRLLPCPVVPASLQFNQPTLLEACRELARGGALRIVVAPYFLYEGIHLKEDIPGELAGLKQALPGVELVLAEPLGADERLVDVISGRIGEAFNGGLFTAASAAGPEDYEEKPASPVEKLSTHPIEAESFAIIDELLKPPDAQVAEYQVARRVVHATGEPELARELIFSEGAMAAAGHALGSGYRIVCDVNMVAAGLEPTAMKMGVKVVCAVAGEETKALAVEARITRGAAGIRRAARHEKSPSGHKRAGGLDGAVVIVGNAPTALFECLRLVREEGARPALIIGVPVGFVGASESKQALMESGLPHITIPGNRGGSSIAVAIANALLRLSEKKEI